MSTKNTIELEAQIHILEEENKRLSAENQKQKETIQWMHDLIWELIRKEHSFDVA